MDPIPACDPVPKRWLWDAFAQRKSNLDLVLELRRLTNIPMLSDELPDKPQASDDRSETFSLTILADDLDGDGIHEYVVTIAGSWTGCFLILKEQPDTALRVLLCMEQSRWDYIGRPLPKIFDAQGEGGKLICLPEHHIDGTGLYETGAHFYRIIRGRPREVFVVPLESRQFWTTNPVFWDNRTEFAVTRDRIRLATTYSYLARVSGDYAQRTEIISGTFRWECKYDPHQTRYVVDATVDKDRSKIACLQEGVFLSNFADIIQAFRNELNVTLTSGSPEQKEAVRQLMSKFKDNTVGHRGRTLGRRRPRATISR